MTASTTEDAMAGLFYASVFSVSIHFISPNHLHSSASVSLTANYFTELNFAG
jgi:hypothetical protein